MGTTLKDLMNLNIFDGMKLIAGEKGLSREINGCGILDYEFGRSLKDRHFHNHLKENQLALTTFLYAKDDEQQINEAIKYLVKKNASGIAIKNVYRLSIHDSVLRYADSMNFPIFLIESSTFFEDLIISITNCINHLENLNFGQKEIDELLYKSLSQNDIKQYALQINPSLKNHFFVIYFCFKNNLDNQQFYNIQTCFKNSNLSQTSVSLLRFNNGFLLIYSEDFINTDSQDDLLTDIIGTLSGPEESVAIGVSNNHYGLEEIKQAIQESFYAALFHTYLDSLYLLYEDLGTYKAIFPFAMAESMQQFSDHCLNSLRDFDAVNASFLLDTLVQYILCNGNLHLLSDKLSLHENTLRYRLEKIAQLTGLNFKRPDHYEQLSLAVKIHICVKLLDKYRICK